jgi:hypothetical protein
MGGSEGLHVVRSVETENEVEEPARSIPKSDET